VNLPAYVRQKLTTLRHSFTMCFKMKVSFQMMNSILFPDNGGESFRYLGEYTHCTELEPSYMPQSWFDEMKAEGEDWEEEMIENYSCNHVI